MNPRILRPLLLLGGLAMTSLALSAQGGPGPFHGGPGSGARLGLNENQQAQFKAIHERHKAALETRRQSLQEARKALHDAMKAEADTKALKAAHQKVADAQFQMLLERKAVRDEILPILTPEQKARFQEGVGEGRGRGRGHGRGHGRGMGPDGWMKK